MLRNAGLEARPGGIVLLIAPADSGKTTLLTLIRALHAMQTGSAAMPGEELQGALERTRAQLRRHTGFMSQPRNLPSFLTARQNVAMALDSNPG